MKPYLKIGLALVVVFFFLMASKLLTSETASARSALQSTLPLTARQAGVRGKATIDPPSLPPASASVEEGKTEVTAPLGGSTSTQFPSAGLSLLGTPLLGAGAGSGGVSITQTGPKAFHIESNSIVNNIDLLGGSVTADRCTARLICDLVSGKLTCSEQSVVFEKLKVNGTPMPNQPEPNTEVVFKRKGTIGAIPVDSEVKVVLSPTSVEQSGDRIMVMQGGISLKTRGQSRVKNNLKDGINSAPDRLISQSQPKTARPLRIPPDSDRVSFLPFNLFRNSDGIPYGIEKIKANPDLLSTEAKPPGRRLSQDQVFDIEIDIYHTQVSQ